MSGIYGVKLNWHGQLMVERPNGTLGPPGGGQVNPLDEKLNALFDTMFGDKDDDDDEEDPL